LDEKKSGNNHATWWTAQAVAYASLVGDAGTRQMAWDHYRNYLVPTEIQPDGSCPREEARTNSLSYSAYNLDAFSTLCRIADANGVRLWDYRTSRGIGVAKAFDYLLPYVLHPDTWKKREISPFNAEGIVFPGLAGVGLRNTALLDGYRSLPHSRSPWNQLIDLAVRTA
jgi:Alginate lyase